MSNCFPGMLYQSTLQEEGKNVRKFCLPFLSSITLIFTVLTRFPLLSRFIWLILPENIDMCYLKFMFWTLILDLKKRNYFRDGKKSEIIFSKYLYWVWQAVKFQDHPVKLEEWLGLGTQVSTWKSVETVSQHTGIRVHRATSKLSVSPCSSLKLMSKCPQEYLLMS